MFPRRLLFAADGSQESDRARTRVVALAQHGGGELHVMHVGLISPWTNPRNLSTAQLQRLREEARVVLDREVEALANLGVQPVGVHLVMGRPVDEVLRLRDEIDADLIAIGSRGLNAFKRVLLGSDAESIVKHAPCSVLVVRGED